MRFNTILCLAREHAVSTHSHLTPINDTSSTIEKCHLEMYRSADFYQNTMYSITEQSIS